MKKLLILILSLSILLNSVFATDNGKTKKSTSSARLTPYLNRSFELIPSTDIQMLIASFIKLYKNFQFLYIPPNNTTNNTNKL